jgi:hypothetical protein
LVEQPDGYYIEDKGSSNGTGERRAIARLCISTITLAPCELCSSPANGSEGDRRRRRHGATAVGSTPVGGRDHQPDTARL